MAKKRPSSNKSSPGRTAKISNSSLDQVLQGLPGGLRPLSSNDWESATQMSVLAKNLIAMGNSIVVDVSGRIGSVPSKPRSKDVEELFFEHAKHPREVPPKLDEELRRPEHISAISESDQVWDGAIATARNEFDKVSVESGANVQIAQDDWALAIRKFESCGRNAWTIFLARSEQSQGPTHAETHKEAFQEVNYYKRSSEISEELLSYEQTMAQATNDLATAFGNLVKQLFVGFTSAAVGEAALLNATQSASEDYWTSVQSTLS